MPDVEQQIARARADALRAYAPLHGAERVEARFDAVVAEFASARVRTFVPVLAERRMREQLGAPRPDHPLSGARG